MTWSYILDERGAPVLCPDFTTWAAFLNKHRRVAEHQTPGAYVSTVFLGIDHGFGGGPPVLFETMIFGGRFDEIQLRCATLEEARIMHIKAVRMVRGFCGIGVLRDVLINLYRRVL